MNYPPLKILIDRNIEINAITHSSITETRTTKWGSSTVFYKISARISRLPGSGHQFRREQIPYLVTICSLARDKAVTLYTSFELTMEKSRQRGRDEGYSGLNMLRGIKLERTTTPAGRTVVFGGMGNMGVSEAEQMEFFNSISDPRFLQIKKALNGGQIDDAFHLWTAEFNNLDIFLTMDKKFRDNFGRAESKIKSPAKVLTPKELCDQLNAPPTSIEEYEATKVLCLSCGTQHE